MRSPKPWGWVQPGSWEVEAEAPSTKPQLRSFQGYSCSQALTAEGVCDQEAILGNQADTWQHYLAEDA